LECGVFKGASFARWATFRELFCLPAAKRLIGFDTFTTFRHADTVRDEFLRGRVVDAAGTECVSITELLRLLQAKGCDRNVELVAGDICETVPRYVRDHPEFRISLLNVDVDFRAATETIIRELYPRVCRGGVVVFDDYATFEGETRAVEELLPGVKIQKFPFAYSPCYAVKE
jgi:hypothetical protein